MARTFTGTGRVSPGSWSPPVAMSILAWVTNPSTAAISRILQNDTDTYLAINTTAGIRFQRDWGGGSGIWDILTANLGVTLSARNHFALTYDGASTANDPTFYANKASKTVTRTVAPAGTIWTTSGVWTLGNVAGGTLPLGGTMEYLSIHNVVLTAQEVADHADYGFVPRGCMGCWPMDGQSPEPDISGNGRHGTVTGTSVVAGGDIYPDDLYVAGQPMVSAAAQMASRR